MMSYRQCYGPALMIQYGKRTGKRDKEDVLGRRKKYVYIGKET